MPRMHAPTALVRALTIATTAAAIAVPTLVAHAQDANQWRVEDGGNGHWYGLLLSNETWSSCHDLASAMGANLGSITSEAENDLVTEVLGTAAEASGDYRAIWIGGISKTSQLDDWTWTDDSAWSFSNWCDFAPNGDGGYLVHFPELSCWDDYRDSDAGEYTRGALIEWSADCNSDGIVDYGQILDGTFRDDDGNGVPDCCGDGTCLPPVQWRVEDGGNGHWYQGILDSSGPEGITWDEARAIAIGEGGDLASLETQSELEWVYETIGSNPSLWWTNAGENDGPYLGGFQDQLDPGYSEPDGGWRWLSGTPITVGAWGEGAPNDAGGQDFLHFWDPRGSIAMTFDDVSNLDSGGARSLIVEWSADCNEDGIVDYGQMLDGTLEDLDDDGVPDECVPPTADVCPSGCAYSNIDDAIAAAADGDTILVGPGTYTGTGNVVFNASGRELTIIGIAGAEQTIFDGQNQRACAWVHGTGDKTVTFVGLTFRNGFGRTDISGSLNGGGISVYQDGHVVVRACRFESNHAPYDGGAMLVRDRSSAVIESSVFIGNTSNNVGGAIRARPQNSCAVNDSTVVIRDTIFEANENPINFYHGGTPSSAPPHLIERCVFIDNTEPFDDAASDDYGMIRFGACNPGESVIRNCVIAHDPDDGFAITADQNGPPGDAAGYGRNLFLGALSPADIRGEIADLGGNIFGSDADRLADCDGDGVIDAFGILEGLVADCNGNLIADDCEQQATLAASEPGTPAGPTDYVTFDVSSLPDARDTVSIEISALGELAGPARFLIVYLDEPTIENRIGVVFAGTGENCLGLVETLEMPVGGWNDAGVDGSRSIIIAGSGLDPICGDDAYTGINVTVPIVLEDCNENGLWDACEVADGSVIDSDEDGVIDDCDGCPDDPAKTDPGVCGCGAPDTGDADDDGLLDCVDPCPNWPYDCSDDGQTLFVAVGQPIQQAIDLVPSGGVVRLEGGIHQPPTTLDSLGKDVVLLGETGSKGEPLSMLDGRNSMRLLNIAGGETEATTIENLLFMNGNPGSGLDDHGGAIRIFNSDATIRNCWFENNQATNYGGAMVIHDDDAESRTSIEDCTFTNNQAIDDGGGVIGGRGGAIAIYRGDPQIRNCTFSGNSCDDEGGAVHLNEGNPSIIDSNFLDNQAGDKGGGLFGFRASPAISSTNFLRNRSQSDGGGAAFDTIGGVDGVGSPRFTNCVFEENAAGDAGLGGGGGLYGTNNTALTLIDCVFVDNVAFDAGGGLMASESDASITGTLFDGNQSGDSGGGTWGRKSDLSLTGCTYTRNVADNHGGAICILQAGSTLSCDQCGIDGNTAALGGGIMARDIQAVEMRNCSIVDNTASDSSGGCSFVGQSSDIENAIFDGCIVTGNRALGEDGGFGICGGLRLNGILNADISGCVIRSNTDAIDSAGGLLIEPWPDSVTRISDTEVCDNGIEQVSGPFTDLGGNCISEFCDSDEDGVLDCDDACPGEDDLLDTDKDGTPDCLDPCPTWPYDCSEDGRTVLVAVGQSIQDALQAIPEGGTVEVAAGTFAIDGEFGLQTGGDDFSIRGAVDGNGDPATILDAGGDGRILGIDFGQSEATVLENLVFTDGKRLSNGGAVGISQGSTPIIRNCHFVGNQAGNDGGAVFVNNASPTFIDCRFAGNFTAVDGEGGGLYIVGGVLTMTGCVFDANEAGGGGGLVLETATGSVTMSTFTGNLADRGGAIYAGSSGLDLSGSRFEGNIASIDGGGIHAYQSAVRIDSSILCGNTPDQVFGGYTDLGDNCIVDDCGDDLDGNGVPDACDPDCNDDGIPDGLETDCDGNGIPDECEITDGTADDCNENGIPDSCDIESGFDGDDNGNKIPDTCDLARGDLNLDGCIDAGDLGLLIALWGLPEPPVGDLDGDGTVSAGDLGLLISYWTPCDP